MQWVSTHLTRHHFFHAPHRWFFAVLLSPIHALELHYKKRYHLTYVHAKKLFFFDMLLVASIGAIIAATLFWLYYNPSVANNISLRFTASSDRIASGEAVSYTITYKNKSAITLNDAVLALELPEAFIIDKTEPTNGFNAITQTFTLGTLNPNANGSLKIFGHYFGTPEKDERIAATMTYRQANRTVTEQKYAYSLTTLRGSLLKANLIMGNTTTQKGSIPFTLELSSDGLFQTNTIDVPLTFGDHVRIEPNATSTSGWVEGNIWHLVIADAGGFTSGTLSGVLTTDFPDDTTTTLLSVTPQITINNKIYPQETNKKTLTIIHPKLSLHTQWSATSTAPGDTVELLIDIQNTGETPLTIQSLSFPIPDSVDTAKLKTAHIGKIEKDIFTTSKDFPDVALLFTEIAPGKAVVVGIPLPIRKQISKGIDISLSALSTISASIKDIPGVLITEQSQTPSLPIATELTLTAQTRFFTDEGDQIGRGTFPPEVGKETRYYALLEVENTTSRVRNIVVSAVLPNYVQWTGKTSVTQGQNPVYSEATHTMTWQSPYLEPHTTAGIYVELAITPTPDMRGKTPLLLQNIFARGTDTFTDTPLSVTHTALDISLPLDKEAQKIGVKIQ